MYLYLNHVWFVVFLCLLCVSFSACFFVRIIVVDVFVQISCGCVESVWPPMCVSFHLVSFRLWYIVHRAGPNKHLLQLLDPLLDENKIKKNELTERNIERNETWNCVLVGCISASFRLNLFSFFVVQIVRNELCSVGWIVSEWSSCRFSLNTAVSVRVCGSNFVLFGYCACTMHIIK